MKPPETQPPGREPGTQAGFQPTRWTLVLQGREGAAEALEGLCRAYWRPLYSFLRRQGTSPPDAEDLTQGFLADLLAREALAQVRPERGKFRSFLLVALQNYTSDQRDRAAALKRGGGQPVLSLDVQDEEHHYALEPADRLDPAKLFDRRWAMTLIETVTNRLAASYAAQGKQRLYDELHSFLLDKKGEVSHAVVAARLGLQESTIGVEVHRLRQRFRELCRREIADTVPSLDQVEEEMRHLFLALRA